MRYFLLALPLLTLFLISPRTSAHQVDSVEFELLRTDGKWKLEGLLDIAYMLPESRGVEGAPPLFRKDVMAYPEAKREQIVTEAERTLRRLLTLKYNGKELPWEIHFPEFEQDPLVLPPEAGGWALMKAEISFDQQPGPGKLNAFWHDDQESALIIIIEEGDDIGLLSISSGTSDTLLAVAAPADGPEGDAHAREATPDHSLPFRSSRKLGHFRVSPRHPPRPRPPALYSRPVFIGTALETPDGPIAHLHCSPLDHPRPRYSGVYHASIDPCRNSYRRQYRVGRNREPDR